MEQKIEINDLKSRLARLEAIINSSLIVDETTSNGTCMSYEEEDTCVGKVINNLYLYQHLHIHTHTHTHTHTGQPVCVDVPDEGPREQLERRDCCPAT